MSDEPTSASYTPPEKCPVLGSGCPYHKLIMMMKDELLKLRVDVKWLTRISLGSLFTLIAILIQLVFL